MTPLNFLPTARAILIGLLSTVFAQAQDAQLSLRTLTLDDADMAEWHVAVSEENYAKLDWPKTQPSPALMVQPGKELQLFSKVANKDGEPEYKAVKKLAIPEAVTEILLLAVPGADDEELQLIVIADHFKQAKPSDWLVINLSERKTSLRFGKGHEAIELASGDSDIYKIEGELGKGGEAVAEAEVHGEMRKIFSTFWSATEKQRSLVLLTEENGRVKVRRIIDFLPAQ